MADRLYDAFDDLRASGELKARTGDYVARRLAARGNGQRRLAPLLAACCALVLMAGAAWGYLWSRTVAFISVDVNPSLELSLNRWERVVEVAAYGEDAQPLLNLPLKGKPYQGAIDLLLAEEERRGYLHDGALVSFTVVGENCEAVLSALKQYMGARRQDIEAVYGGADLQEREQANSQGLSTGKYRVIQELLESDPDLPLEDCRGLSMGELRALLKQNQTKAEEKAAPLPKERKRSGQAEQIQPPQESQDESQTAPVASASPKEGFQQQEQARQQGQEQARQQQPKEAAGDSGSQGDHAGGSAAGKSGQSQAQSRSGQSSSQEELPEERGGSRERAEESGRSQSENDCDSRTAESGGRADDADRGNRDDRGSDAGRAEAGGNSDSPGQGGNSGGGGRGRG